MSQLEKYLILLAIALLVLSTVLPMVYQQSSEPLPSSTVVPATP